MAILPAQCAVYAAGLLLGAAHSSGHEVVTVYVRQGSNFLLPGVDEELKGSGASDWLKMGSAADEWILTYHHGSAEPEVNASYSGQVTFFKANGSLLMFNATTQKSGRYTLRSMNGDKFERVVTVLQPISEMDVVIRCALCVCIVECKVSGDVWNMTWKDRTGELIHNASRVGNILTLTVPEDSYKTYNCVAWNPVSELWKTFTLVPGNPVALPFISLLIASLTFSIPKLLCWTKLLLSKIKFCCNAQFDDAAESCAFVTWLLFLICSLMSTSLAQSASSAQSAISAQSASILYSSPVPYEGPAFNIAYLVVLTSCLVLVLGPFMTERLKIVHKQWIHYKCRHASRAGLDPQTSPGENDIPAPYLDAVRILNIIFQLCALGFFIASLAFCFKTYSVACHQPHGFAVTILISALVSIGIVPLTCCICRFFL